VRYLACTTLDQQNFGGVVEEETRGMDSGSAGIMNWRSDSPNPLV